MSTQRRRQNRSLVTKITSIEQKAEDAQLAQKAPARGSVTESAFADGAVGPRALQDNSVNDKAIAPAAVNTEHLGVVNEVNSDSTLVLDTPVGVALSGEAYADRAYSRGAGYRAIPPRVGLGMDSSGTLVANGSGLGDAVRIGQIDPYWLDGPVGVYFDGRRPKLFTDSTSATSSPWVVDGYGFDPDIYAPWVSDYSPKAGEMVVLVHDTASTTLVESATSNQAQYYSDGWVIVGAYKTSNFYPGVRYVYTKSDQVNNLGYYSGSTYGTPVYTKSRAGIVAFNGMWGVNYTTIPAGGILGWVTPDCAPDFQMDFVCQSSAGHVSLRVMPDGSIRTRNSLANGGWISLSSIAYPAVGTPWTPFAGNGTWSNGFGEGGDVNTGDCAYYLDWYGFAWFKGVTKTSTPTTNTAVMFTFSDPLMKTYNGSQYRYASSAVSSTGFSNLGSKSNTIQWLLGSSQSANASFSLAQIRMPVAALGSSWDTSTRPGVIDPVNNANRAIGSTSRDSTTQTDQSFIRLTTPAEFQNGWDNFNDYGAANTNANTGVWSRPDGLVLLQGLMSSGTYNGAAWTLDGGQRPSTRLIFPTVSNSAAARLDVLPGSVLPTSGAASSWFSLDCQVVIRQQ